MRAPIWLGVLLGSAAFSAAVFQPYEPDSFQDYAAQKVDHLDPEPLGILQQSGAAIPAGDVQGERRTDFQVFRSRMSRDLAGYLEQVFALTDAAAVEWRAAVSALSEGRQPFLMDENYGTIINRLKALNTPDDLLPFEAMVAEAIDAQRRYLRDWEEAGRPDFHDWDHGLLDLANARLSAAYAFLMRRFPDEDQHNQRAFRDHLTVHDFFS
ncbi:MAG: hypothetical protein QNJ30_16155 [Kiloniellales bacterium]|nr:hypothetical protein [Kiloniellales bacterium]